MTSPVQVESRYSREELQAGARCFVKEKLRRAPFFSSCIVIAIGFGVALAYGVDVPWMIGVGAGLTAMGPLYIAYLYAAFPHQYAKRLAPVLTPTSHICFSESTLEISSKEQVRFRLPWSSIKEVCECPASFLIVISWAGASFIVVPKNNLSREAHKLLAEKGKAHAV